MSAAIKVGYKSTRGRSIDVMFWVQEDKPSNICSELHKQLMQKLAKTSSFQATSSALAYLGDGIKFTITDVKKNFVPAALATEVCCFVLKIATGYGWEIRSDSATEIDNQVQKHNSQTIWLTKSDKN